ncbi:hypothetical protein JCGZ_10148 [Jatropha curcas]|uniref:Uncharacterized protein n=1 Tax=Jatropha curcas TaxID=180498 RepID=A0A067LG76_JATCU|nr:hypothetical protein JCGZ_10148 [Jatropha curcas]
MFRFIAKLLTNRSFINSKACSFRYFKTLPPLNPASTLKHNQSLTIPILINSCGLSLQRATSVAKYVNIYSTKKPDLVLQLLRDKGFSKSEIARLISQRPDLLLADPEKTLKPKIEFFESLGLAGPDLRMILTKRPSILKASLKNRILPVIDFLKEMLDTVENVTQALKGCPRVFLRDTRFLLSKIGILRANGVPKHSIRRLMILQLHFLLLRVDLFEELVREIKDMGFEPFSSSFVYAVHSMSKITKTFWESKKKLLMSFGWSEQDFLLAFRAQPLFMVTSENKMKELMEFYLTKVSLEPSDIVKCPNLLQVSLKRRVIPRCSVMEVLMSKELIKKDVNLIWILNITKERFEKRYFTSFKEDYPELISAYQVCATFEGFSHRKQALSKK